MTLRCMNCNRIKLNKKILFDENTGQKITLCLNCLETGKKYHRAIQKKRDQHLAKIKASMRMQIKDQSSDI